MTSSAVYVHLTFRYRGAVRKQNLRAAVTVCWLSASLLGLIPLSGWHNHDTTTSMNSTLKCHFLTVISMSYMVNFNFLVCILSPTIIMMAIYAFIFCKISKQLRRGIGEAVESRTFYHKERRLAHSLALVLALFAVSWFPLHILNTLTYYTSVSVPPLLFHIGVLLSHANSAVNPIVYAFKIPKIKIAYKNILKKLTGSKENPDQISQTLDNNISSNSNSNVRYSVKNSQKDKTNINQDA